MEERRRSSIMDFILILPFAEILFAMIFLNVYLHTYESFGFSVNYIVCLGMICLSIIPITGSTWVKLQAYKSMSCLIKTIINFGISLLVFIKMAGFNSLMYLPLLPILVLLITSWAVSYIDLNKLDYEKWQSAGMLLLVFPLFAYVLLLIVLMIILTIVKCF